MPRPNLLLALGLLPLALLAGCGGPDTGGGALVGKAPPSLESEEAVWVRPATATDWPRLSGQVVFLEFGFLR
jgi:hypothetical protein